MPNFNVFNSILWSKKSDKKEKNMSKSSNKVQCKPVVAYMEPIKLQIELPYQQYFTDSTESDSEKTGKTTKRYSRKRNKSADRGGVVRVCEDSGVMTRAKSNTISLRISFDAPVYSQAQMSYKLKSSSSVSSTSGYSSSDYKETVSSPDQSDISAADSTKLSPISTSTDIIKNSNIKQTKKSSKNDHIYDQLNYTKRRCSTSSASSNNSNIFIVSPLAQDKSESSQQYFSLVIKALRTEYKVNMQGQHNISSAPRKGTKSAKNKSAPLHTNNEIIRWAFKDFDDRDNLSIVDADDDDYVENDRHVKSTKSTDSQQENTENNAKPKKKKNGLKLSSSMSKSIPGILQKNITTERKFIKDLLSLSQQRQVNLLLLDFQKKSFINKQAFKGIYPLDSRRSFSVNQNNNNNNHSRINEISSSASTRIKSSSSSLKANSSNDLSNGFQSSSMMRRRSSNLSTLKLNTELTRLHQIEMSELTENYNKLSARRNGEKYRVSNSSVEGHVIEDIAVINVPENVNNEAPKVENLQTKPKTVKLAATIALSPRIDKNTDINPDSFRKRADPKSDTRYQDLLVSMSTVYTPKKVSKETPDERIYRLLRSNTAFLTSSSDARSFESLLEKSKPIRRNVKENLHFFEKSISCL